MNNGVQRWCSGKGGLTFPILGLVMVVGLLFALAAPSGLLAAQPESTPDAEDDLIIDSPDTETSTEESTPAVDGGSLIEQEPASQASSEEEPAPAAIAQGLIFLDETPRVWQVREVELQSSEEAQPFNAVPGFFLQRTGDSIVRNDITGKRAKLEPGDAYFTSDGDPYTAYAGGGSPMAWSIDLVTQDAVADDAFYESPPVEGLAQGTFDLELIRFSLEPGATAELPPHNGQALMLVTRGEVTLADEGDGGPLAEGEGQLTTGAGSVENGGSDPAIYVIAAIGDQVEDEGPAADPGEPTPPDAEESTEATPTDDGAEAAPADTAAPEESDTSDGTEGATGTGVTSIAVSADAPIYVEVVADGETAFADELDAGETTGQIAGSEFRVYTSSGISTIFTNACGDTFQMGFEEGEATYTLTANEDSCPPA